MCLFRSTSMPLYLHERVALEQEDLVLQLRDGPWRRVSQLLQMSLHGAHHGWWTAHEDFRSDTMVWRSNTAGGLVLRDHVFGDEACSLGPVCGWLVEAVLQCQYDTANETKERP